MQFVTASLLIFALPKPASSIFKEYNPMFNANQLLKTGVNALSNNAPAILTAFGAVGVVGTAVLTAKATFEAAEQIREAQQERSLNLTGQDDSPFELTNVEKVKLVWPLYIGAVSSGVLSCGAIVMSHRISSKRAAVLAAAYALNENKLEEYQDKVKEKFGVKKEKEVRDGVAQDRVNQDYEDGVLIFDPDADKMMIKDEYSGRYFYSTIEDINRAVNEVNAIILRDDSVTLSEFYRSIKLPAVATSDDFGWNTNNRLEIDWSTCTSPEGKYAVHSFDFVNPPIMNPGSASSFR